MDGLRKLFIDINHNIL